MRHDEVFHLRQHSAAWRLLRADNAALVIGFLGTVFVSENVRTMPVTELADRLADELEELNAGTITYPRPARAYVEEWAAPAAGWLRKYYPPGADEPHVDATPALEKAVAWVDGLQARAFVGTESRLHTVVELLRQMVYGAETDPAARLVELRRRRAEIDAQIAEIESGHVPILEGAAVRDRYQQFVGVARELLADFREVETNFRVLDRELRERIATWRGSKGELLDEVLDSRGGIAESDQGRTFHAFYDFLLSRDRQEELVGLLDRVHRLEAVGATDERMRRIHDDWLDAGERTQATVRLLSEQLRRFLDDQVWMENRRVLDLLRNIEATAIGLRRAGPVPVTTELDEPAPRVALPMERPLYAPRTAATFDSDVAAAPSEDVDAAALFEQVYVDRERLARDVRRTLGRGDRVDLLRVLQERPLELGLAELTAYLSLTQEDFEVQFDAAETDEVGWFDVAGTRRVATLPRVTFARPGSGARDPEARP